MTLREAVDEFLIDQQIRGNSPNTVKNYERILGYFLDFAGREKNISELTIKDCKQYYLSLAKRSLSTVTIQTYIRQLRAFLTWCYHEEYIPIDVPERFRLPKAKRRVIDVLTDDEILRLLGSFDKGISVELRNYCICCLMLDSGLRMNEVVTLKVGSVHISEGYAIVTGKGDKERFVPLGLNSKKALLKYIGLFPNRKVDAPLFVKDTLTGISLTTVKQLFRALKGRTNIPRLKAHLLRHTFATRYLENGGDIYSLQQILGHTSLEMVKRYVHFGHRETVRKFTNFSPIDNLKGT